MSTSTIPEAATLLPPPPLVPGLPLIGSAPAMTKDLIGFIVEQYQTLGPIFRIRALQQEFVVLAGPEANLFVTREGADKFSVRETWEPFGKELGVTDYIQDLDGEPHVQARKLMKRGYSSERLLAQMPLLINIAQQVFDRFPLGEEVPALYLLRLIVTEQLGSVLAGHAPGKDLEQIITTIKWSLKVHVTKQTPAFFLRLPFFQRAKSRYLQLGREIIAEHQTPHEKPNLVDDLVEASKKEEYQYLLGSEAQLATAALGPFVAGLDTVANECTFMLRALLEHPDLLQKCVEEADSLFSEGIPTHAKLRSIRILQATMLETLRLYSIAPAVTRNAAKDFDFAGHHVKKGQNLILASTASHFLPEFFPNPHTFDVERYSETRKEHKQRGAFAPFGIGTHTCLGAGAAESQMILVMASLLHMVRLEWANPNTKLPIKLDPTPTLGYAFRVRIAERRHHIALEDQNADSPDSAPAAQEENL